MKTCASFLSLLVTLAGCPAWAEGEYAPVPDRRSELDARIEALDAERAEISTEGPMAATVFGLALTVAGGALMGASYAKCKQYEFGCEDTGFEPSLWASGFALLLVGPTTALVGGIIWGVRADRRNDIDAERESLIEERDGLAATLSRLELQSPRRNGTQFVTLGVRF